MNKQVSKIQNIISNLYRVSQQIWNILNVTFWSSETFASEASYHCKKDKKKRWNLSNKKGEIYKNDPIKREI